jgi:DUF2934 family protein
MATRKTAKYRSGAKQSSKAVVDGVVEKAAPASHANGGGATATSRAPTFDEIRAHAYEMFVARGGVHGDDLADWFAAENNLRVSAALK